MGRGAPRTSVPAYCCHNRCLQHGLGRYMQRAGSLGALDRTPTALAHELPRAVHLALRQFQPLLLGKHVLVRTDYTAPVSYINRLGDIRSHYGSTDYRPGRLSAPILSIFTIIDIGHFQNRFADNYYYYYFFFFMQTNILFTGDIIYW